MERERFVLDYPAWEFFPSLQGWADRLKAAATRFADGGLVPVYDDPALRSARPVGSGFHLFSGADPVFRMWCAAECEGGAVVDIEDGAGILHDIRMESVARVALDPANRDPEGECVAGPYPVLDGGVLFETLRAKVGCRANLERLGVKGLDGGTGRIVSCHDDSGVYVSLPGWERVFSVKEIDAELSFRRSVALGNYSYDDLAYAARDLSLTADPNGVDFSGFGLKALCDHVEETVGFREGELARRCRMDAFLGDEVRSALSEERKVVELSGSLLGLKRSERLGGLVLGRSGGLDVVVKERQSGARYVAFCNGEGAVSLMNAVRGGSVVKPLALLDRVMDDARRRDKSVRLFRSFCRGVTGGREKKMKI